MHARLIIHVGGAYLLYFNTFPLVLTNPIHAFMHLMDGRMDGWTDGWLDGWMDGRTDEWMDGWTNRRSDAWMDRNMGRHSTPKWQKKFEVIVLIH